MAGFLKNRRPFLSGYYLVDNLKGNYEIPSTRKSPQITNYVAHSMALFGSIAAVLCAIFIFVLIYTVCRVHQ